MGVTDNSQKSSSKADFVQTITRRHALAPITFAQATTAKVRPEGPFSGSPLPDPAAPRICQDRRQHPSRHGGRGCGGLCRGVYEGVEMNAAEAVARAIWQDPHTAAVLNCLQMWGSKRHESSESGGGRGQGSMPLLM